MTDRILEKVSVPDLQKKHPVMTLQMIYLSLPVSHVLEHTSEGATQNVNNQSWP